MQSLEHVFLLLSLSCVCVCVCFFFFLGGVGAGGAGSFLHVFVWGVLTGLSVLATRREVGPTPTRSSDPILPSWRKNYP